MITGDSFEAERLDGGASDSSAMFENIRKRDLADRAGVDFLTFRRSLRPAFVRVWVDLGAGLVVLGVIPCLLAYCEVRNPIAAALLALPAAAAIGYVVAYINLFFHEAAHFNIAASRSWNDRLANVFVGILMGQDIRQYRVIHFQHHRYLGTTLDTERSYFDALTAGFILESLTGLRVLKVLRLRESASRAGSEGAASSHGSMINVQLLLGLALHGSVLAILLLSRRWFTAAAWIVGVALVYPFLNALRNLLEHRSEKARPGADYTDRDQGSFNRLFGDGLFAATFGGAGFNRHLLHHWDPQVSYTCLGQLERFLLDTDAAAALRLHQTTYWATFRALFVSRRRAAK
jgi:fatty acid desaturase